MKENLPPAVPRRIPFISVHTHTCMAATRLSLVSRMHLTRISSRYRRITGLTTTFLQEITMNEWTLVHPLWSDFNLEVTSWQEREWRVEEISGFFVTQPRERRRSISHQRFTEEVLDYDSWNLFDSRQARWVSVSD